VGFLATVLFARQQAQNAGWRLSYDGHHHCLAAHVIPNVGKPKSCGTSRPCVCKRSYCPWWCTWDLPSYYSIHESLVLYMYLLSGELLSQTCWRTREEGVQGVHIVLRRRCNLLLLRVIVVVCAIRSSWFLFPEYRLGQTQLYRDFVLTTGRNGETFILPFKIIQGMHHVCYDAFSNRSGRKFEYQVRVRHVHHGGSSGGWRGRGELLLDRLIRNAG